VRPAAATTPFAEAEIAKMRLQKIQPQDFTWANAGPSGNGGIGNWHDVQIVEGTGYAVARKRVLAVDPLTNKLLWTWDRIAAADALPERARDPSRSQNLLAILPEERLLLLEVEVGFTLIALDLDDGHLRWAQPHAGFLSSVAVAGGVLYHYTAGGLGPRVVARDLRDGRLLADGAIPVPKPNGFDVRCRVALVDDTLFFGSGETSFAVHGLNRFTLAPAFKSVAMPAEVWTLFPAVSPGKKGVVAMAGRQAYKVGLDGKATKGAALQGELARTPPFDDDRALYLSRYYTTLSFAISKDTAGLLWTHKGTGKYAELQGVLPGGFAIGSEEGEGGTRVVVVRTKDGQVLWREPEKPEGGRDDRLAGPIYGAAFVGGKLVLAGERGFYLLAE
jgi:outer membrane protein assembly factor BamB